MDEVVPELAVWRWPYEVQKGWGKGDGEEGCDKVCRCDEVNGVMV